MLTRDQIESLNRMIGNDDLRSVCDVADQWSLFKTVKPQDAWLFVMTALEKNAYKVARYIIENFDFSIDLSELLAEGNDPAMTQFIQAMKKFRVWQASHPKSDITAYYMYLIEQSIQENNQYDLQYMYVIHPEYFTSYRSSQQKYNILQYAITCADDEAFNFLMGKSSNELRSAHDSEGNSLAMLAVKQGKLAYLQKILDWNVMYQLEKDVNQNGETLFDVARLNHHEDIMKFIYQYCDSTCLDILPQGLMPASFFDEEHSDLSVKSIALMLHYFQNKKPQQREVYLISETISIEKLVKTFDLFVRSSNDDMLLYFDNSVHRNLYKCEKHAGISYIIVVDSLLQWVDGADIFTEFKKKFPESFAKVVFLKSDTHQQTAVSGCRYYALKNLSKVMNTPSFYPELAPFYTREVAVGDVMVQRFSLPPRFMTTTSSHKKLREYENLYPDEVQKPIKFKDNKPVVLAEEVVRKRDKYQFTTPEIIANNLFKPGQSSEPPFIAKNNSIGYFKNKYLTHTIVKYLESYSNAELADIIVRYDGTHLTLDPKTNKIQNTLTVEQSLRLPNAERLITSIRSDAAASSLSPHSSARSKQP
jgi:hypothetical protein